MVRKYYRTAFYQVQLFSVEKRIMYVGLRFKIPTSLKVLKIWAQKLHRITTHRIFIAVFFININNARIGMD